MNTHATKVIEALGGTAETARLFGISMPSVSDWKKDGIPRARMMFLQATRANLLNGIDLDLATSHAKQPQAPASQALAATENVAVEVAHG